MAKKFYGRGGYGNKIEKLTDGQLMQRIDKINIRYKPLRKYYIELTNVRRRLLNEIDRRGLKA